MAKKLKKFLPDTPKIPETPVVPEQPQVKYTSAHLPQLLGELVTEFADLRRHAAGYFALTRSFQAATGQVQEGERRIGLPVFEFKASADAPDGRGEVVTCAVDLRDIPPNYLGHVLVPIMTSQGGKVLGDVAAIRGLLDVIEPLLKSVITPPPQEVPGVPAAQ